MRRLLLSPLLVLACAVAASCSDDASNPGSGAGADTGADASSDVSADTALDTAADTALDTALDTAADSGADSSDDTSADSGVPHEDANGCSFDGAVDRRGEATVDVSAIAPWNVVHEVCVIVSPGTTVEWRGNFEAHPLVGGVTPTQDDASPITAAGADVGDGVASATLADAGDYPYFCVFHTTLMQGVVYVD